MHCTATNGGIRTSTLAPGAVSASERTVSRTASASSARAGSGCRWSCSQSASADRRRGSSPDRHNNGRPYLDSQSACRPPPSALQTGRSGVGRCRRRGRVNFLQFRGDLTHKEQLTLLSSRAGLVVDPGSKVTYNRVEIGRVSRIGLIDVEALEGQLTLDVDPDYLGSSRRTWTPKSGPPRCSETKIVSFSSPEMPAPRRISSRDVIDASAVTTEFNTLSNRYK